MINRIAFIDHSFHRKTKSSHFFVKLLEEQCSVDIFYTESNLISMLQELVDSDYDIYVLWQTEYLAPYFIMNEQKVVCVPMYDGVANMPEFYWHFMRQARIINFSSKLHNQCLRLGLDSFYIQYFKNPEEYKSIKEFSSLNPFFWCRRPEDGLDARFAMNLFAPFMHRISNVHIHDAPDSGRSYSCVSTHFPYGTKTIFNTQKNQYMEHLNKSNLFLSPRYNEGIGMSNLEALASGMIVIAHNDYTAKDYILSNVNGIIIDYFKPNLIIPDEKKLKQISNSAINFSLAGYKSWQKQKHVIISRVLSTVAPKLDQKIRNKKFKVLKIVNLFEKDFERYLYELSKLSSSGLNFTDLRDCLKLSEILKYKLNTYKSVHFLKKVFFYKQLSSVFRKTIM